MRARPCKVKTMTLVGAVLFAWATAAAQGSLDTAERLDAFRRLDANGDGWLSRAEAAKRPEVGANFQRADANRDGRLSFAEFETIPLNRSDQPGGARNPDRG